MNRFAKMKKERIYTLFETLSTHVYDPASLELTRDIYHLSFYNL